MANYDNIKVQDVTEVILINDTTGEHFFFGCTEETSITKEAEKELLTCGIGNKQVGVLWTGQSYNVMVQPLYFQESFMALQGGTSFQTATFDAYKTEEKTAVDDGSGGAEVTIDGTPLNDEVIVLDKRNEEYTATFATGTVSITDGVIDDEYIILYQETESTADILDFDPESFPKNVHLQLRTIAYNPETDEVLADLYWDFPRCSPDGALDLALTKGSNSQNPIDFDILIKSNSYGSHVVVPRA